MLMGSLAAAPIFARRRVRVWFGLGREIGVRSVAKGRLRIRVLLLLKGSIGQCLRILDSLRVRIADQIGPRATVGGVRARFGFRGLDVDKRGQIPWIWDCCGFGVAHVGYLREQDLRLHCATGDEPAH